MELHNTIEDLVTSRVNDVFAALEKEGSAGKYCSCNQCRLDVICYVLNRIPPHYIVSNRGVSRVNGEGVEHQQQLADIESLIHEGFKRVNHNQRPFFSHSAGLRGDDAGMEPVFNIPTIMGRLFNGENFSPLSDVDVEILQNGALVPMKNGNWQNPLRLVYNTEGNFSFWPATIPAHKANEHRIFEYSIRVSGPELETLVHFFKIPVASEIQAAGSFNMNRTFKLPDLYMFPPGEAEKNGE